VHSFKLELYKRKTFHKVKSLFCLLKYLCIGAEGGKGMIQMLHHVGFAETLKLLKKICCSHNIAGGMPYRQTEGRVRSCVLLSMAVNLLGVYAKVWQIRD